MEVVVTEEKKKIFRARKTMKISDRQQLESLHTTLLTAAPGLAETSLPPLMNGTHKEDGQKVAEKDQNNISDSNSPSAASPASPAPFLSLNLSPSPASSHSPKEKEESPTSPTSPFHSLNFELKKMEEDEEDEEGEKKVSSSSSSKDSVPPAPTESKDNQEKNSEGMPEVEKKEEEQTKAEESVGNLSKDSVKGLVPCLPEPPPVSDCTEPMDTDSDTTKAKDHEASTAEVKEETPSSPKSSTSDSALPCPSPSHPASLSPADLNQETEIKEEDIKEEEKEKGEVMKGSKKEAKMQVDSVKVETKKEKTEIKQTTTPSRPSSTPPSNTVLQEEKGFAQGLKRTLSEGHENDGQAIQREGKRPKVEREELEAQLEVKITAKAGSHHKIEMIVQQLLDERLKVLELTIFEKHLEELRNRVDQIDCATKHQTAINTLQAKIARQAKKFGEANQLSENKRKQEALAAVAAATAAASAAAAAAAATAASTPKTPAVSNIPQAQRVLRRQTVEPQPEVPKGVVPSVGKNPVLSGKKDKEEKKMEEEDEVHRHIAMAKKLAESNDGKCKADIKLRTITSHLEKVLFHNCKRSSGIPRADRYASYIFRYLVPYDVYCDWVAKVNYIGLMGKEALPKNLRKTMRMYIDRRFPGLSCDSWRDIRDVINEILRVKRRPEFFREYDERTTVSS